MTEETTEAPKKTRAAATKAKVPHVYTAILEILKNMSVEKNGKLPGNMGGGSYVAASDLSAETKAQFVEQSLVFLPSERLTKHEVLTDGNRKTIFTTTEGEYRIISVVDGSEVTIRGAGDGIATGSAVASNVSSTNALKNALLRTFLVTETSVEDAAKNGPKEAPEAIRKAQATPAPPSEDLSALRAKVKEIAGDRDYMALGNQLGRGWTSNADALRKLIQMLEAGETA